LRGDVVSSGHQWFATDKVWSLQYEWFLFAVPLVTLAVPLVALAVPLVTLDDVTSYN